METMIAYCGLNCYTCPIHLATNEPDQIKQQKMRESIAELCTKQYGMNLQPEDITDCDGCRANAPFATIMPAIYFRNILSTIRKHKYGLKISDGKDTIEHFDNI
jgi:hypothetical protein